MAAAATTIAELRARVGSELGVSDWHVIDQERISGFAGVTEDFQFIHVDPARAAAQFGGTIAHGFLALSLLSVLFVEAVGEVSDAAMSMNYGFDKLRFLSPVRSGKRIRGRFALKDCAARRAGQWMCTLEATVEIEGEEKPALAAVWLVLLFDGT